MNDLNDTLVDGFYGYISISVISILSAISNSVDNYLISSKMCY